MTNISDHFICNREDVWKYHPNQLGFFTILSLKHSRQSFVTFQKHTKVQLLVVLSLVLFSKIWKRDETWSLVFEVICLEHSRPYHIFKHRDTTSHCAH